MSIFKQLVSHFGTQEKTAKALGVDQGTVSGWVRGKHGVSPVTALRIEALTEGQFRAKDLCPALADLPKTYLMSPDAA